MHDREMNNNLFINRFSYEVQPHHIKVIYYFPNIKLDAISAVPIYVMV